METETIRIEFKRMPDEFASVTQDVTIVSGGLGELYTEVLNACRKYQSGHGLEGADNAAPPE